MISVLILTRNEEQDLPGCLESVRRSDDIHVYDSYSADRTLVTSDVEPRTVVVGSGHDFSDPESGPRTCAVGIPALMQRRKRGTRWR